MGMDTHSLYVFTDIAMARLINQCIFYQRTARLLVRPAVYAILQYVMSQIGRKLICYSSTEYSNNTFTALGASFTGMA